MTAAGMTTTTTTSLHRSSHRGTACSGVRTRERDAGGATQGVDEVPWVLRAGPVTHFGETAMAARPWVFGVGRPRSASSAFPPARLPPASMMWCRPSGTLNTSKDSTLRRIWCPMCGGHNMLHGRCKDQAPKWHHVCRAVHTAPFAFFP